MASSKSALRDTTGFTAALRIVDVLAIGAGGVLAYLWRFGVGGFPIPPHYTQGMIIAALLGVILFPSFGMYEQRRGRRLLGVVRRALTGWGAVLLLLMVLAAGLQETDAYSRLWFTAWAGITALMLLLGRAAGRRLLNLLRRKGWNRRRVLIAGAGILGRRAALRLRIDAGLGLDVVGYVDDDRTLHGKRFRGATVLGTLADAERLVHDLDVDELWVTLPMRAEDRIRELLHYLRHTTVAVRLIPDIFVFRLLNHGVAEVAGLPLLDLSASPMVGMNRVIKALEDRFLAALILILASPLLGLIAIGVKLSSPGPVLYRQERVGWNGHPFEMLKFRSMPVDAEKNGICWGKANKKATTRFGRFLRRTSLDELPQFINVLKGEMSIVGPRPERTVFVEQFKDEIPDYMKKHVVKAGMTGWAQIHGLRGDTSIEQRIEHDLYYIENWSLWLDLRIIFLTATRGLVNTHRN